MKSFNYYGFFTLYAVLFILVLYKVLEVPVTHDEVPTALFYSKFNPLEIMMFPDNIPNNHILNTLLTKYCIYFFGTEQWAIRLPNLLSFIVFAAGVFKILIYTLNKNSYYFLPLSILFINPYLLDFFCLSRGYGLSAAIMTLSLSYLISGFYLSRNKHIWISLILAVLASYANFTSLIFWVTNTILVFLYFFKRYRKNIKINLKPFVLIFLISIAYLALIIVPIQKMQSTNEFQYWTSEGFYTETILSLIHNWRYDSKILIHIKSNFMVAWIIAVLITNCVFLWTLLRKNKNKSTIINNPVFISTATLILTVIVNLIQTLIMDTPNLQGRTALIFYPLFSATLVGFFSLITSQKNKTVHKILAIFITALCLANLASRTNLQSVKEWSYDQNNLDVANFLKEKYKDKPVSLKTSWFFNPSFTFYSETGKISWIDLHPYDSNIDINTSAEYYYIFSNDYKLLEPKFEILYKFSLDRWLVQKREF